MDMAFVPDCDFVATDPTTFELLHRLKLFGVGLGEGG